MKDDTGRELDVFGNPIDNDANLPISADSMLAGLNNVVASIGPGIAGSGLPFLGLSRAGNWTYGAESIRVDEKSEIAPDLRTLKHGWVCWDDGRLLGEIYVGANESLPREDELPPTGATWAQSLSVEMVFLAGPDEGVKVQYKTNSHGGKQALVGLIDAIKKQVRIEPQRPIPVMRLRSETYQHKKYGPIVKPVLQVIRWTDGRDDKGGGGQPRPTPRPPQREEPVLQAAPQPTAGVRRRRVDANASA